MVTPATYSMAKKGLPSGVSPPSKTPGDGRVIHQRERLWLRVEPQQHLPRVHPRFDELDRHPPPHRLALLGKPDLAHAPFGDALEQLVAPEQARVR